MPASVTFVSPSTGWVLGNAPCGAPPCTSLVRTGDGGKTWIGIPAPRVEMQPNEGVRAVRFADLRNGWAFGPELWTTHDGGTHWARTTLPGFPSDAAVFDLQAANGVARAAIVDQATGQIRLMTTGVGTDEWKPSTTSVPLGAGPVPHGQLVLHGASGWMVEVDRVVVGGARLRAGDWVLWAPPCKDAGGPMTVAAASATDLVAVCDEGIWTGPPEVSRSYFSTDGGTTFTVAGGALPPGCCPDVASASAGTAVVGARAADGSAVLLATADRGASWSTVYRGAKDYAWDDLGFTTESQGVAVSRSSDGKAAVLLMTFDGGRVWTAVTFA